MIAWNGVERWKADCGVLRDRAEIEMVDFEGGASFGEDWRKEVDKAAIKCKWVKLPYARIPPVKKW